MNKRISAILTASKPAINNRYAALEADLEAHIRSWRQSSEGSEKKALATVGKELQSFLGQRKVEIEKLIFADPNPVKSEHIRQSLLMAYLGEAIRDWDDIKQAFLQRQFYETRTDLTAFETLKKADQLAYECLQKAKEAGALNDKINSQNIVPICYFDKNSSTISAPYTDLPLVGIPITATMTGQNDLYAILHEMGHFTYWHLEESRRNSIERKAEEIKNLNEAGEKVYQWLEEIFADVFASLVGGAQYDQQFRDLLLSSTIPTQENFQRDDHEHPPTVIRPYAWGSGSEEWDSLLGELGIDKGDLSEAQEHLKTLADHIRIQLSGVTRLSKEPAITAVFTGQYVYDSLKSIEPITDLEESKAELTDWDKDLLPLIGICC
ncbi:MAG: hypothetical protein HYR94_11455 [Chloroflexi bacterium]|nr:hypothetical protein [Chloroflexota bacterium]